MSDQIINIHGHFTGSWLPNWLLKRSELSQGAKLCYARLAQYAVKEGYAYPSLETLSDELGSSLRQLKRYVKELTDHKLIKTKRLGLGRTNRYYFLQHEWMTKFNTEQPVDKPSKKPKLNNQERTNMTPTERPYMSPQKRTNMAHPIERNKIEDISIRNKIKKNNKNRTSTKKSDQNIISAIFEHWKEVMNHSKAKLDDKRRRCIQQALGWGYSQEDLITAIYGCKATPFNMGENERSQVYDSIHLIFRDADHIDRFLSHFRSPPKSQNTLLKKNISAAQEWLNLKQQQNEDVDYGKMRNGRIL